MTCLDPGLFCTFPFLVSLSYSVTGVDKLKRLLASAAYK
jgi:hypothetical protein